MGTEFTIKIDEPTLKRLKTEYGSLISDMDTRLANYQWDSGEPKSTLILGEPFPMHLGGADFTEAVGLANALDVVRKNLTGRFDTVYTNASDLYWGLQFLLADSDAVENLAKMTAQQFDQFIPTDTTQGASSNGPTATNSGGS
ncbi:MAG: hypothetical protein ACQSGP_29525 [Frankia sp.]